VTVRSLQGTSVRREDGRVVLRHSAGRVRRDEDVQAEAALDEPRSHLGDEGHRYRDRRKCRPRGPRFTSARRFPLEWVGDELRVLPSEVTAMT